MIYVKISIKTVMGSEIGWNIPYISFKAQFTMIYKRDKQLTESTPVGYISLRKYFMVIFKKIQAVPFPACCPPQSYNRIRKGMAA